MAIPDRLFLKLLNMKKVLLLLFTIMPLSMLSASTVDTVAIYSPSMQKSIKCVVIKPDNYPDSDKKYPVVYLLHGYSGSYSSWLEIDPNLKDYADEHQMILVCPDGGYNSWYYDSPIDPKRKYETHVSKEVVSYVDVHYRTIADRHHRAITGLSMGGHGGFYLGLRHPDVFGAMGSTSGGVDITPFKKNWEISEQIGDTVNHKDNWKKMTVINMLDDYPTDSLTIIFDCGTDDFFYEVNKALHNKMLEMKIPHDYIERPGEHNWPYWKNSIEYQLVFFKNFFAKNSD